MATKNNTTSIPLRERKDRMIELDAILTDRYICLGRNKKCFCKSCLEYLPQYTLGSWKKSSKKPDWKFLILVNGNIKGGKNFIRQTFGRYVCMPYKAGFFPSEIEQSIINLATRGHTEMIEAQMAVGKERKRKEKKQEMFECIRFLEIQESPVFFIFDDGRYDNDEERKKTLRYLFGAKLLNFCEWDACEWLIKQLLGCRKNFLDRVDDLIQRARQHAEKHAPWWEKSWDFLFNLNPRKTMVTEVDVTKLVQALRNGTTPFYKGELNYKDEPILKDMTWAEEKMLWLSGIANPDVSDNLKFYFHKPGDIYLDHKQIIQAEKAINEEIKKYERRDDMRVVKKLHAATTKPDNSIDEPIEYEYKDFHCRDGKIVRVVDVL